MGKIKVLDEKTINQIAAGEVVENPATIIKELLENALDAGAKNVTIETKGAGRQLIRISDDGCGMNEDDLLLAVERHATSKILNAKDLFAIQTLGFRGEALASIAAVSKMMITSSTKDNGAVIRVNGGQMEALEMRTRQRGTTVEVRQLFYNTPARLAFQKSTASDTANIHKVLVQLALSAPHLGITWLHDGRVELELLANQTLSSRIAQTLGESTFEQLMPVGKLGFIGKTTAHRPNRLGQFLILNGRVVQCPFISKLVLESYGTRLPARRFPLFVLDLHLPGGWIDVNVHPQKKEVRLTKTDEISKEIGEEISRCFQQKQPFTCPTPTLEYSTRAYSLSEPKTSYEIAKPPEVQQTTFIEFKERPIGLFSHYLLLESDEGLQIVDLHRATYRIRFEEMKQHPDKQALLIPHPIEVSKEEKVFLMEHYEKLESCGIALRPFGGMTFLVEAVPNWIEVSEIEDLIRELVSSGVAEVTKALAKRGRKQKYQLEEGLQIMRRLAKCDCTETTPDGVQITVIMTKEKLHDAFK